MVIPLLLTGKGFDGLLIAGDAVVWPLCPGKEEEGQLSSGEAHTSWKLNFDIVRFFGPCPKKLQAILRI